MVRVEYRLSVWGSLEILFMLTTWASGNSDCIHYRFWGGSSRSIEYVDP